MNKGKNVFSMNQYSRFIFSIAKWKLNKVKTPRRVCYLWTNSRSLMMRLGRSYFSHNLRHSRLAM